MNSVFYTLLLSVFIDIGLTERECHSGYEKAHLYLSTKTPYTYIANKVDRPITFPGNYFFSISIGYNVFTKCVYCWVC